MQRVPLALAATFFLIPSFAPAQSFDDVGIRAVGMAGAFVAVADDASASFWNPAGLATGPFFSMSIEYNGRDLIPEPASHSLDPARGHSTTAVFLGTPPLGISYVRQRFTETRPVEVQPTGREADRNDEETY